MKQLKDLIKYFQRSLYDYSSLSTCPPSHICLSPSPASSLRALSEDGPGRLPRTVALYRQRRESLCSHALDDLTALPVPLSPLFSPTAPDQTHSDRGRDTEAKKQGK